MPLCSLGGLFSTSSKISVMPQRDAPKQRKWTADSTLFPPERKLTPPLASSAKKKVTYNSSDENVHCKNLKTEIDKINKHLEKKEQIREVIEEIQSKLIRQKSCETEKIRLTHKLSMLNIPDFKCRLFVDEIFHFATHRHFFRTWCGKIKNTASIDKILSELPNTFFKDRLSVLPNVLLKSIDPFLRTPELNSLFCLTKKMSIFDDSFQKRLNTIIELHLSEIEKRLKPEFSNYSAQGKIVLFKNLENHKDPRFLFCVKQEGYSSFLKAFIAVGGNINLVDQRDNKSIFQKALNNSNNPFGSLYSWQQSTNLFDVKTFTILLTAPGIDEVNQSAINDLFLTACSEGQSELVKLLLTAPGIDVNKDSPLESAACAGHIEIVKLLLTVPGIDVNKDSPLESAASCGHIEIVKLLLALPRINVDKSYLLRRAARAGHIEIVKLLLALPGISVDKSHLLWCVAWYGHTEIVKLLLADPRMDVNKNYPLQIACEMGHIEIVKLLLADPRIDVNKKNSLKTACENGHVEIVKLLLADPRIDLNLDLNKKYSRSPLQSAARAGHIEIVKLLLTDPRIDVNKKSPLKAACEKRHIEIVKLLLAVPGIDVNKKNPLQSAASYGYIEIVKLLIADPRTDVNNDSPLSSAACHGHIEVVKLLLAHPRINVNKGLQLRFAVYHGHTEIVKLLKSRGAQESRCVM